MILKIKNKDTLIIDEFKFRCAIGKNGIAKNCLLYTSDAADE